MTEQQPPALPNLTDALDAVGADMGRAIQPLVDMVRQRDDVLAVLAPRLVALQESHTALLEFIDRMAVRPNWATDVRTLEQARALQESLTPPTGGPTT